MITIQPPPIEIEEADLPNIVKGYLEKEPYEFPMPVDPTNSEFVQAFFTYLITNERAKTQDKIKDGLIKIAERLAASKVDGPQF